MTMADKVSAAGRAVIQRLTDREPVNYIEAGGLYGIVAQGRHNIALLSVLYNQARDSELRELIKQSIDGLTQETVQRCEDLLQKGGAELPAAHFFSPQLEPRQDLPISVQLSAGEIAIAVANIAKVSQTALLAVLHQTYQPEIAIVLRTELNNGLDWGYRMMQLMLHRGWLLHIAKVHH